MGPNRIARRDWLLGTSASLVTVAATSASNATVLWQPGMPTTEPQAASEGEDADRIRRMKWWHEARFGMFIHWGLYSVLGRHEWVMEEEGIPVSEYELLAKRFQPQPNAARAWAKLAKTAGQKYMVMTTKHHEGFCHFDSKLTNYSAPKTACGRDLVREYVDAHLGESMDLAELAAIAGLSVFHFARQFKQSAGITPHHYLVQRRIERAQDMLARTDLALSEIAVAAGFSDQSHLSRHFRQILGTTPREFRWSQR